MQEEKVDVNEDGFEDNIFSTNTTEVNSAQNNIDETFSSSVTIGNTLHESELFTGNIKFGRNHSIKRGVNKLHSHQRLWSKRRWVRYSVWTIWALLLMIILGSGSWAFPDGNNPTCSDEDAQRNKAICHIILSIQEGRKSLLFLSSFILAGFLMSTRSLWLLRRTNYQELCGAVKNLLLNVTTLIPDMADQRLLARWTVLAFELTVLKARSLADADEGRRFLEMSSLLVGDEWEAMVNGDRHTTVWYWIQAKATQLNDNGRIDHNRLQNVCYAVTGARDKSNDLMSCIDRDQPSPYIFVSIYSSLQLLQVFNGRFI